MGCSILHFDPVAFETFERTRFGGFFAPSPRTFLVRPSSISISPLHAGQNLRGMMIRSHQRGEPDISVAVRAINVVIVNFKFGGGGAPSGLRGRHLSR